MTCDVKKQKERKKREKKKEKKKRKKMTPTPTPRFTDTRSEVCRHFRFLAFGQGFSFLALMSLKAIF